MEPDLRTDRQGDGIVASLRRLADTFLGLLQTRVEIFSTEIAEERFNLARIAVIALSVLFCLQTGVILAVLFFVLSVSDENRLLAIGIAAGVLLLLALLGTLWMRRWLRTRPPMFAATIEELRKDRELLERRR